MHGAASAAAAAVLLSLLTATSAQRPRIVGGQEISPAFKYPFLVSLRRSGGGSHFCGGSLIEKTWVLTAAHCISTSRPGSDYAVMIHGHSLSNAVEHECTEVVIAARTICHDSYDSQSMLADICLIQLSRAARCGERPGATTHLDQASTGFTAVGTEAVVAGWGATHTADGHAAQAGVPRWPDKAREVVVPLISNAQCKTQYGASQILQDMVCGGIPGTGGIDSCQGDSGGPLFITANARVYQIGVVSWGAGCGLASHAGVYARVAHYRAWIISHVPALGRQDPPTPPALPAPPFSPPPPPSLPSPPASPPSVCSNGCSYASDGDCDDGGTGAEYNMCTFGDDCVDCGGRQPKRSPPPSVPPPLPSSPGAAAPTPTTASPPPSPPPALPPFPPSDVASTTCTNTCHYASDSDCDDGGPGAEYSVCRLGTDCTDCTSRVAAFDPPPPHRPPSPPTSPPPAASTGCSNQCNYASDGDCDDGGAGAEYSICSLATDCNDCGHRSGVTSSSPPPTPPPPPPTSPPPSGTVSACSETCNYSYDGDCDDGGQGSEFSYCDVGTDCHDCGARGLEGGSSTTAPPATSACGNTCNYNGDGDCDDGGPGAEYQLCDRGTDCADCGTAALTEAEARRPSPPPPFPPNPPPSPIPSPGASCLSWCDSHSAYLAGYAAQPDAGALGPALTFATHIASVAATAGYALDYLTTGAPPSPTAPPPVADASLCFDTTFAVIVGCACHASCLTCGFGSSPTSDSDCLTCRSHGPLTHVNNAGPFASWGYNTGFCDTPPASASTDALRYLCYQTCAYGLPLPPPPPPNAAYHGGQCADSCSYASDGDCDDGGMGSEFAFCASGTDCADCGVRGAPPSPPKEAPRAPPLPPSPPKAPPPSPLAASSPVGGVLCSQSWADLGPSGLTDAVVYQQCQPWCTTGAAGGGSSNCHRCECALCSVCAPSAPPPSLPPTPAGMTLRVEAQPSLSVVLAGSVNEWSQERLTAMKARVAERAGVPVSMVDMTVAAASVSVTFRVHAATGSTLSPTQGRSIAATLATTFSSAAAASAFLQAPVVSTPNLVVTSIQTFVVPLSPPSAPPPAGEERNNLVFYLLVVGLPGLGSVIALGAIVWYCSRRARFKTFPNQATTV